MTEIRFPEFIASQEPTTYPFTAGASLTNGKVSLLQGTFLDAHVYPLSGGVRHYISSVTITSQSVRISVGDSVTTEVASGSFPISTTDSLVRLIDQFGRPAGVLVSEPARLAAIVSWGLGRHVFELTQTEFCLTCQLPVPDPGVTGFKLPDGSIVTGKVWLVGEEGVVLQGEPASEEGPATIQVNVVGDPLYLQKLCTDGQLFSPVNPVRVIRVINNSYTFDCFPDEQGNFSITVNNALAADAAMRIRTTVDGLVIEIEGSTT